MNESDPLVAELVERHMPARHDEPGDWDDVLRRIELPRAATSRRWWGGRVVLALAAAAVVALGSAFAVGASQGWWFLRSEGMPKPIGSVDVVKTGSWDGKPWVLTAYLSSSDGICFGITPGSEANDTGQGAAQACDQITGVPSTLETKPGKPHGITFLSGGQPNLPRYIVGPVVDTAQQVRITLTDGEVIETPTFAAPADLGAIRFYADSLPSEADVSLLVGVNVNGQEVARLQP